MRDTRQRTLAKTVTWRLVSTLGAYIISFGIVNSHQLALKMGALQFVTKTLLYYFYERLWTGIRWQTGVDGSSTIRSLSKSMGWNVIAAMDTLCWVYIFLGEIRSAITVAFIELITKFVLYYFHERVWNKVRWGSKPVFQ